MAYRIQIIHVRPAGIDTEDGMPVETLDAVFATVADAEKEAHQHVVDLIGKTDGARPGSILFRILDKDGNVVAPDGTPVSP